VKSNLVAKKKVSIIFPALNEEETIGMVIEEVPKDILELLGYDVEIIVVDNNSTDKTGVIADNMGAIVLFEPTRGKGNAMKKAFGFATGDYIFMLDADFTYPSTYIQPMLSMLELDWDVILCTRIKGYREPGSMSSLNLVGNRALALLANILYGTRISDVCSGSWGMKRDVVNNLKLDAVGFELEANMFVEIAKKGYRIGEIPIVYRKRPNSPKISSLRDGFKIGRTLLKKKFRR